MYLIDFMCILSCFFSIILYISITKSYQVYIDIQIYHKLKKLNVMSPNLPEQPTKNESKLKETLQDNLRFIKSLLYVTKKVFML